MQTCGELYKQFDLSLKKDMPDTCFRALSVTEDFENGVLEIMKSIHVMVEHCDINDGVSFTTKRRKLEREASLATSKHMADVPRK